MTIIILDVTYKQLKGIVDVQGGDQFLRDLILINYKIVEHSCTRSRPLNDSPTLKHSLNRTTFLSANQLFGACGDSSATSSLNIEQAKLLLNRDRDL